jgi:hypothetical protein
VVVVVEVVVREVVVVVEVVVREVVVVVEVVVREVVVVAEVVVTGTSAAQSTVGGVSKTIRSAWRVQRLSVRVRRETF